MLETLKSQVYAANMELMRRNLVIYTWGNASAIDENRELVVIKPSGVSYSELRPEMMVIVDLEGNVVSGHLKPSSDTATHLVLYKKFGQAGAVVHTHSTWATIWSQSGMGIPALGTTHADYFYGEVPCTREMKEKEVITDYEKNTGLVIAETFKGKDPMAIPAVLVKNHGPFTWGRNADEAVHNSVVLEEVARMAFHTIMLGNGDPMPAYLLDKHYLRKHGKKAYYGQ
ncbi:MAG: L-ribulose-5-phosphate 4-epimerase [Bacteroidales bacterium]